MVPANLVEAEDWDGITALAKQAVMTMLGAELRHVGINCENADEASKATDSFAALLGGSKEGGKSFFAGKNEIELMKAKGRGANGHLAIAVTSVERAMTYYETQGFTFDMDTITYDDAGKPKFVYFTEEIGGFAVHLIKK